MNTVEEEWHNISQQPIIHFIRYMPNHMQAVIRTKGSNTQYQNEECML